MKYLYLPAIVSAASQTFIVDADHEAYPPLQKTRIIEPTAEHTHTVIALHGLEGDCNELAPLFEQGGNLFNSNRKVVLPSSP